MTQEEKEILLKDLCARLPYGVVLDVDTTDWRAPQGHIKIKIEGVGILFKDMSLIVNGSYYGDKYKPYLRPMSSMTEEECVELSRIRPFDDEVEAWKYIKTPVPLKIANIKHFDFFHSHHLDWRGLIEKGLALEAPEGMYNLEKK